MGQSGRDGSRGWCDARRGRLLGPVSGWYSLGVNGLDAALRRPVVLKGGALGKVLLDFLQRDDSASFGGEKLVPDALNFAAEFQIGLK